MVMIPMGDVGRIGIVKDIPADQLPPNAWSAGSNVRFRDDQVEKFLGHKEVFATPNVPPRWAIYVPGPTNYWLYGNLTKLSAWNGATHADATRTVGGDYSTSASDLWIGGLLSGTAIITNGVDDPQFYTPGGKFADLTNWPANTECGVIRPFLNYLIAMHITKNSVTLPHMVKWSDSADPGTLPGTCFFCIFLIL